MPPLSSGQRGGEEVAAIGGALDSHQHPPTCVQPCCRPRCAMSSQSTVLHKSSQMKMEEMSLSGLDNSKLEVRLPSSACLQFFLLMSVLRAISGIHTREEFG